MRVPAIEQGNNLRYIQKLLGHKSLKTTFQGHFGTTQPNSEVTMTQISESAINPINGKDIFHESGESGVVEELSYAILYSLNYRAWTPYEL